MTVCEGYPCSPRNKDQRPGAEELMDEYWFFNNMLFLTRKAYISRMDVAVFCSNTSGQMVTSPLNSGLVCKTNLPNEQALVTDNSLPKNPSAQPFGDGLKVERIEVEERLGLPMVPRLQPSVDDVPSHSSRPSRRELPEVRAAKPSIPRDQSRRNSSKDGWQKDSKNQPNQSQSNFRKIHGRRTWKSLKDLEFEEVQGFLDLGFTFNKEDISPSVINMIPGLQEKRMTDSNKVKRPYISEAWLVRRTDPPLLNLLDRKSSVEVKEQLKVWAKTVAFRVSREC